MECPPVNPHWKHKDFSFGNPQLIEPKIGVTAFPKKLQSVLKRKGIEYYLKLETRK